MNENIKYTIKYTRRKTIEISIDSNGMISVVAPFGVSDEKIEKVINSKEKWILNKLSYIDKKEKLRVNHVMFLGKQYPVKIMVQRFVEKDFVVFNNDYFLVTVSYDESVTKTLERWFMEKTEKLIIQKVNKYKHYFDREPELIKVKEQKRRWGSCTYDNKLLFNWKLSMAREDVLEYVVIHEMCHMIHKNHSKEYWNEVSRILPDYKNKHKWLKDKGHLLTL